MANYAPCPKCSGTSAEPVKFTWWGGVLGPKLLHHVKCSSCSSKYNGRSGKDNAVGIMIYFGVVAVVSFAVALLAVTLYFASR
jgi:hypothetical protein